MISIDVHDSGLIEAWRHNGIIGIRGKDSAGNEVHLYPEWNQLKQIHETINEWLKEASDGQN